MMKTNLFSTAVSNSPSVAAKSLLKPLQKYFFLLVFMLSSVGVWGQTDVSYTALTTVTCPAEPVATISPSVTGLTFSQISRGSGVTCSTAGGSISGSGFNGNLAANLTSSRWYTFSISVDAANTFKLNSLKIVSRVSNAGGSPNVSIQYSIGGGSKIVIGSFTPTAIAATYTITPGTPIDVLANQTIDIFIIPNSLTAAGTTCRVENATTVNVTAAAAGKTSNAGNGNWNTPGTWSPSGVPLDTDIVTIPVGSTVYNDVAGLVRKAATNVNGTFQVQQGSYVDSSSGTVDFIYGSAGSLIFNNSSGSYGVNSTDRYWPTTNPPINVTVMNTGGITMNTARTVSGIMNVGATLTNPGNITIGTAATNSTLQLNSGYSFSGTGSPTYGNASLLRYNSARNPQVRSVEWNQGSGTIGTTAGYPNNVQISGNTTLNFSAGTTGTYKANGNLTIDNGSSLYQNYGGNNSSSIIGGNLVLNGILGLGGDLTLAGDWTQAAAATFSANSGAVFFNGTTNQNITKTGGGIIGYDYLVVNKASGNVILSSSNATSFSINATSGSVLQLINAGNLDLNGQSLIFNNTNGNILVNAVGRTITSSAVGAMIELKGNKFVSGAGSLILDTNVKTILTAALDFGSNKTTIKGILQIDASGYANNFAPIYTNTSTLIYNRNGVYDRGLEWSNNGVGTIGTTAGYPNNVQVSNTTTLNYRNGGAASKATEGNLTIDSGSFLYMNYGGSPTGGALIVKGNVVNNGTFGLGDGAGDDLKVGGNWTNTGTFTHNTRLVTFNGTTAQTLTGATTFEYLTLDNVTGLTLQVSSAVTVNKTLALTSGKLTLGANDLTIGSTGTITGASTSSYVVTNGAGQLKRNVNASAISFPVGNTTYNPIIFNNSGTADIFGVRVSNTAPTAANDVTRTVNRQWITTETVAGGSNLSVVAQYNIPGEIGANFSTATDNYIGYYDGSSFTQVAGTGMGANPYTVSSNTNVSPADLTTGTKYFAIGRDDGLVAYPKKHFRSNKTGDWKTASAWDSSLDGISWAVSTTVPTKDNALDINIQNAHTITISTSGVSMTNTTVKNGGTLEITTTNSFDVSGALNGIELTIENGGIFLVNSPSDYSVPTGNAFALVKTGGKLVAGPNMGSAGLGGTGTAFSDAYLGTLNGLFYFGDQAICEWSSPYTVLGSKSPADKDFFFPRATGDMPIFRISTSPLFPFGSAENNTFYAVLEANAPFSFQGGGSKTFNGGITGTSTVTQNTGSGKLILGDGSNVPTIGGSVTLYVLNAGLQLPYGANVPVGATPRIASTLQNYTINRQAGNLTIDGALDITNLQITNPLSGGIFVNGTLRTANTFGLYGTSNTAVPGNTLNLNSGSTVDYYATANQTISNNRNYFNITFSGAGIKSYTSNIIVNAAGLVKITGTTTVDATGNLASPSSATAFTMDGGRLILRTTGTQPNMDGTYTLTGGVVEFANSSVTAQTIRSKAYQNIEVTGTGVGNSSGNITLNTGGTFKVRNTGATTGGIFSINDDTIKCPTSDCSLTIEDYATFRTGNKLGFSGQTIIYFPTRSTSINADLTNITLATNSIVEYIGTGQIISQGTLTSPTDANYQNLTISGADVKQDQKDLKVNEKTTVTATGKLTIPTTSDNIDSYVLTAKKGLFVIGTGTALFKSGAQLMQNANIANTGNIIMERNANVPSNQYNYWSSPVKAQVLYDLYPNVPWNRVMVYNTATDFFTILPKVGNPQSDFGKGYSIKGPTIAGGAITASFLGVPNNESATAANNKITLLTTGNRYNLIGNPFPSNLDITEVYNSNKTQFESTENTIYFWDNESNTDLVQMGSGYTSQNNYATMNAASGVGVAAPRVTPGEKEPIKNIKPGQGFIMRASSGATALVLANTMRTSALGGTGVYYKGSADLDKFWLQFTTPENMRIVIAAGYFQNAENKFDPYDSPIFDEGVTENFYSLSSDAKKLAIQGRKSDFDISDIIPLTAKIHMKGNAKISLYKKEGVFENDQAIYLHDKLNNSYTNLNVDSYNFAAVAGNIENRFEIVYKPGSVLNTNDFKENSLQVYRDNQDFIVQSSSKLIDEVEVFDVSGRLMQKVKGNSTKVLIDGNALVSGVYLLKIKRNKEIISKKIIK